MGQKGGRMLDNQSYYSSRLIFAKAKYYPTKVQIFIPIIPFSRDEHVSSDTSFSETSKNDDELNLERSLRRTRQRISDYVLCNQFELFVTFTFAKNRQDINEKRRQMANWLKNQRKRNGKFDYLIVPEFHKDRQSLHFHALFYGYCGAIRPAINPTTNTPIIQKRQPIYTLPEYTLGFNNAKRIMVSNESTTRIAQYIKKYITKDMPIFFGKQRYWASKDLRLPKIQYNPEPWFKAIRPDWGVDNEFGRLMEFNIGKNSIVDRYWGRYYG